MRRISLLLILGVILVWAGTAVAEQEDHLKGQYAFTGGGACLVTLCGFEVDLTPKYCDFYSSALAAPVVNGVLGLAFSKSFSVQGVMTFDGKGYGTVYGTAVTLVHFPASASSERFRYQFTYKVWDDGTITTHLVPGSFKGKVLTGRRAILPGQTFTIDKWTLSGRASEDLAVTKSLTLATKAPEVATVRFSNWDVFYEICHSSNVLIRLENQLENSQED